MKFLKYYLPPVLWMAFIFPLGNRALGSSKIYEAFAAVFGRVFPRASAASLELAYIVFRKSLHFVEYGLLAYLLYRALLASRDWRRSSRPLILAGAVAVAYGFLDEFLQSFVPNRWGSPFDWAVDTAGVVAVLSAVAWAERRRGAGASSPAGRPALGRGLFLKRPFDIALSSLGLALSAPLWPVIAAAVKLQDGGPVFYAQERVGRHGRLFKALKFRSMIRDAEAGRGPVQAVENDPRVTPVGRILRATAMDELPQLLNIFKGDMSFVGPRALRPSEFEVNGGPGSGSIAEVPGAEERHEVRPGLTGLTQVHLPGDTPRRKKFRYDLLYIRKRSFCLDLKLIVLSFWITFRGKWESRSPKL
jgi:lipopolysaccharide/colanic/teichoic acid biosynthesis glycosyltransferase